MEELEPNYEVQVFQKGGHYCIDSNYFYSDNATTALHEGIEYFKDTFTPRSYDFVVEYCGEFQSDRAYEMSFNSQIKNTLDLDRLSSLINKGSQVESITSDLKLAQEKIRELENSNLPKNEKELQIKVLRDIIRNIKEVF